MTDSSYFQGDKATGIPLQLGGGGGGGLLQVKSVTKSDVSSFTATGIWETIPDFSLVITPSSVGSKILLIINLYVGAVACTPAFRLVRNASPIAVGDAAGSRRTITMGTGYASDGNQMQCLSSTFLDEPATVSAITYTIETSSDATPVRRINAPANDLDGFSGVRSISTITAIEI